MARGQLPQRIVRREVREPLWTRVTPVYALNEKGEEYWESVFYIDSNDMVPKDRYTREEWEPSCQSSAVYWGAQVVSHIELTFSARNLFHWRKARGEPCLRKNTTVALVERCGKREKSSVRQGRGMLAAEGGTTERRFELEMGQAPGIGLGLGNSRGPDVSVDGGGELAELALAGGKRTLNSGASVIDALSAGRFKSKGPKVADPGKSAIKRRREDCKALLQSGFREVVSVVKLKDEGLNLKGTAVVGVRRAGRFFVIWIVYGMWMGWGCGWGGVGSRWGGGEECRPLTALLVLLVELRLRGPVGGCREGGDESISGPTSARGPRGGALLDMHDRR
ncbi:hypothetical protein C8J57DRAFT_1587048 [Mycena rebaudengoi]|nr:hypothetical protein C8J57DRAFT_1587048 [Mycena rebaudengoi]